MIPTLIVVGGCTVAVFVLGYLSHVIVNWIEEKTR